MTTRQRARSGSTDRLKTPVTFSSPELVVKQFRVQDYVIELRAATTVFVAEWLVKPVLIEGACGAGKTELARIWARCVGRTFVRLDARNTHTMSRTLEQWEQAKAIASTSADHVNDDELPEASSGITHAIDWLLMRKDTRPAPHTTAFAPLFEALRSAEPVFLLIDDIDLIDASLEPRLLSFVLDFLETLPRVYGMPTPRVVLSSGGRRSIGEALRERALLLALDLPTPDALLDIIPTQVPGLPDALGLEIVTFVAALWNAGLDRKPGTGHVIEWARALRLLDVDHLDADIVDRTMNLLLFLPEDLVLARALVQQGALPVPSDQSD